MSKNICILIHVFINISILIFKIWKVEKEKSTLEKHILLVQKKNRGKKDEDVDNWGQGQAPGHVVLCASPSWWPAASCSLSGILKLTRQGQCISSRVPSSHRKCKQTNNDCFSFQSMDKGNYTTEMETLQIKARFLHFLLRLFKRWYDLNVIH